MDKWFAHQLDRERNRPVFHTSFTDLLWTSLIGQVDGPVIHFEASAPHIFKGWPLVYKLLQPPSLRNALFLVQLARHSAPSTCWYNWLKWQNDASIARLTFYFTGRAGDGKWNMRTIYWPLLTTNTSLSEIGYNSIRLTESWIVVHHARRNLRINGFSGSQNFDCSYITWLNIITHFE